MYQVFRSIVYLYKSTIYCLRALTTLHCFVFLNYIIRLFRVHCILIFIFNFKREILTVQSIYLPSNLINSTQERFSRPNTGGKLNITHDL